jgi:hypothetical protein
MDDRRVGDHDQPRSAFCRNTSAAYAASSCAPCTTSGPATSHAVTLTDAQFALQVSRNSYGATDCRQADFDDQTRRNSSKSVDFRIDRLRLHTLSSRLSPTFVRACLVREQLIVPGQGFTTQRQDALSGIVAIARHRVCSSPWPSIATKVGRSRRSQARPEDRRTIDQSTA